MKKRGEGVCVWGGGGGGGAGAAGIKTKQDHSAFIVLILQVFV